MHRKNDEREGRTLAARDLAMLVVGELTIVHGGHPVALPASKKTRALLGFLAVTARPHLRVQLCDLLWDAADNPRAALRWSLAKLRPIVNSVNVERLLADRERASLDLQGASLDLTDIKHALRGLAPASAPIDTLRRASEIFRGDFLEGLDLPDCPRFQAWCQAERAEVRRIRLAILTALVAREEDPDARVRYAQLRVALDPYNEAAHVDLISLLGKLGRAREAGEQYEQCQRLFERDLGIAPSPRLRIARAEVRVETIARASGHSSSLPARLPPPAGEAPLVGRSTALASIDQAFAAAGTKRSLGLLLVDGEPGMGKTRLIEEAVERARARGKLVLSARAFEAEKMRPYGIWIDALRSAPRELLLSAPPELAVLIPELASSAAPPADRARLLDRVRNWLDELARRGDLFAIILDDVHWIDDASAALLSLTARTCFEFVIIGAARSEEIEDNPSAVRLVRSLRREGRLVPVQLGPLDFDDTSAIVRALAPGVDVGRVHTESAGNPLFVIEIVRALARGNDALPETLRGIVDERIERLEPNVRDALSWAATFGKSFHPELLAAAAGIPSNELPAVVAELERRSFFHVAQGGAHGEYEFFHELIRRAVYLRISEPRRRTLHRHVAAALAVTPGGQSELAGEVARHAALGGDDALAARHYRMAAERCQMLFANTEAIALADHGLRHAGALPREGGALALEIALRKVQVCSGAGPSRRRELEAALMRLANDAQRAGALADASEALYVLSILHHEGGNFSSAAASVLRAAEASRATDPATRARSLANAGRCLAQIERDMPQSYAMLTEAHALAQKAGLDLIEIPWGLAVVRHFAGDFDEASTLYDRALSRARDEQNRWVECECLTRIVMIALECRRVETALARGAELTDAARKMGDGSEAPAAEALMALARAVLGEADADEHVEAALGSLRVVDAKGMLAYTLTFAAELDLATARLHRAQRRAEEALTAAEAVARATQATIARAILARALFAQGKPSEAKAILERAAHDATPVSARARAMLSAAAALVGASISLAAQTLVPTVES